MDSYDLYIEIISEMWRDWTSQLCLVYYRTLRKNDMNSVSSLQTQCCTDTLQTLRAFSGGYLRIQAFLWISLSLDCHTLLIVYKGKAVPGTTKLVDNSGWKRAILCTRAIFRSARICSCIKHWSHDCRWIEMSVSPWSFPVLLFEVWEEIEQHLVIQVCIMKLYGRAYSHQYQFIRARPHRIYDEPSDDSLICSDGSIDTFPRSTANYRASTITLFFQFIVRSIHTFHCDCSKDASMLHDG